MKKLATQIVFYFYKKSVRAWPDKELAVLLIIYIFSFDLQLLEFEYIYNWCTPVIKNIMKSMVMQYSI